jgi:hypothetical protein
MATRRKTSTAEKIARSIGILSFVLFFWLDSHYRSTCPATPDLVTGHTIPYSEHGKLIFMTPAEHRNLETSFALFFGIVVVNVIVTIESRWRQKGSK